LFSGIQEILVILLVILAIFFIPRMLPRKQLLAPAATGPRRLVAKLSGRMRLAIVVSVIWLLIAVAYFEPWHRAINPFLYFGVCPVAIAWGVIWIFTGFRKK